MTTEFDQILKRIHECRRCQFWAAIEREKLDYRPEIPDLEPGQTPSDFKVMTFGINPGWAPRWEARYEELRELYLIQDFGDYRQALRDWLRRQSLGPGPYAVGVAKVVNAFNEHMKLFVSPIDPSDVWRKVFWSNLSFCASQTPRKRVFGGRTLPCNVPNEEIPNCLDAGFATDLYRMVGPKLVLFFARSITDVVCPSKIVQQIVYGRDIGASVQVETFSHAAHIRTDGKVARVQLTVAKVADVVFAFLPHPNYPMSDDNRSLAIREICVRA
jgi:hypothetical protein